MHDAPSPSAWVQPAYRPLRYAAIAYAVGFALHTADHLRRGLDSLTPQVLWAGNVSSLIAITAIVVALVGHRLAPAIAAAHGFSQALGVTAAHLLPAWGAFSDPLVSGGADVVSWVAVLGEIVTACAFGVAGAMLLRRNARRTAGRRLSPGDQPADPLPSDAASPAESDHERSPNHA